jgi:CheY-like chemotaxis protein
VSAPATGALILVAEDDNAIRETLRAILEEEGYPVATASNGLEALQQLAVMGPPRLFIIDLVMPMMSGQELCAELAGVPELSRVPVLIVSANAHLESAPPGLETVHVMKKPISFDRLLEYVERYCKTRG